MLLIGESINATIPSVNQAIINKDKAFIAKLTQEQCAAGAHYIDVNAGTGKGDETKDLLWLTAIVQGASDKPLCLDSSDPKALEAAVSLCQMPPILNSICAEPKKLSTLLPIIEKNPCRVIALAHGEGGIPDSVEERMRFASIVIKELRHAGLNDDAIFLDPVLMGLSTNSSASRIALETIKLLRQEYKNIHIILPLSNISFGIPGRSVVNCTFMAMTAAAGADSYILDIRKPAYSQMMAVIPLLLGNDKFCKHYIKAHRQGLFD